MLSTYLTLGLTTTLLSMNPLPNFLEALDRVNLVAELLGKASTFEFEVVFH